jgi:tetratricopeptide (TPR) repeat protein
MSESERKKTELLDQCRSFALCRNVLAAYSSQAQLDSLNSIQEKNILFEAATKDDGNSSTKSYNPSCRQVDMRGMVIQSVEDIFTAAASANRHLGTVLNSLESDCGLSPGSIIVAPLKTKDAIMNKAKYDYNNRSPGPPIAWCLDIVRGSVICSTVEEIDKVVKHLCTKSNMTILRLKNRFKNPLVNGYRDLLINAKLLLNPQGTYYHTVEIQIHHRGLKELSTQQNAYGLYEYFRRFFAHLSSSSSDSTADGGERHTLAKIQVIERVGQMTSSSDWSDFVDSILKNNTTRTSTVFSGQSEVVYSSAHFTALQLLLSRIGEYSLAERVQRHALDLDVAKFGSDNHLAVIESMHHLMVILKEKKNYAGTEEICRRLIAARTAVLGVDHVDTAKTQDKLAEILFRQRMYEDAETAFYVALQAKEAVFGSEHEATLNTMDSLVDVLRAQEKFEDAEGILHVSLETREKILGANHPGTMSNRYNLACLEMKLGKWSQAEVTLKALLTSREKVHGTTHPQTTVVLDMMGQVYEEQSRFKDAEIIYQRCLQAREKGMGPDHKDTLHSVFNLANVCSKQNQPGRAAYNYYRAYRGFLVLHGEDHPKTVFVFNKSRSCLAEANRVTPQSPEEAKLHLQNNIFGPGKIVERVFEHAKECQLCMTKFTVVNREHHCRLCYKAVCQTCSPAKQHVPILNAKQHVRLCLVCIEALKRSPRIPAIYEAKSTGH